MIVARLDGVVVARSGDYIEVENSLYFPRSDVLMNFLVETQTRTRCPWRGIATYFDVAVSGRVISDAAWSYEKPKIKARRIQNYIAFWKDIDISN
ncbi:MAG: hypothetical protein CMM58_02420 [Rhodospirillaceae bacterium]|nr:hypothetical protein [Rhodospirillaceae bacterium]